MVRDKVNAKKTSLVGEPPASDGKRKKLGKAKNQAPAAAGGAQAAAAQEA